MLALDFKTNIFKTIGDYLHNMSIKIQKWILFLHLFICLSYTQKTYIRLVFKIVICWMQKLFWVTKTCFIFLDHVKMLTPFFLNDMQPKLQREYSMIQVNSNVTHVVFNLFIPFHDYLTYGNGFFTRKLLLWINMWHNSMISMFNYTFI